MSPPATAASQPDAAPRGWVVVGALFLMLGIVVTGRNSIGLMMPFWQQELGWSYGFVATAGAVALTVMAAMAPVGGLMLDRFGARVVYAIGMTIIGIVFILCSFMTEKWHLVALYSILGGVGFAVISPSLVATTAAGQFRARLGLATGIATSGATGGQLAFMPLLGLLVVGITWRPTFLVIGIAILAAAVLVQLLIRNGGGARSESRGAGFAIRPTLARLGGDRTFWLLTGGFVICGFTTAGVIKIHLIPYAVACGFPPVESSLAYGVLNCFSLIGMIIYGHLSDRLHRPLLLASIYFLRALTFVLLMHVAGSSTALFVFAVLFGLFDYATVPIVASLIATHIGRNIMGLTMGLIFAGHSLGAAAGSFMGGWLFDLFARYDWVWIVSTALAAIAALLSAMIAESRTPSPAPAPA